MIGAGAVVPEGTRVPEGSLVLGVPGGIALGWILYFFPL